VNVFIFTPLTFDYKSNLSAAGGRYSSNRRFILLAGSVLRNKKIPILSFNLYIFIQRSFGEDKFRFTHHATSPWHSWGMRDAPRSGQLAGGVARFYL